MIITQNLSKLLSRLKRKELQKLQRNFEEDALREIWELEVSIIFRMHNDEFYSLREAAIIGEY